jgi:Uri superfamily endonuclease
MGKQHSVNCAAQQDDPLAAIGPAPGSYALLLQCERSATLEIGSLGSLHTRPGCYLYIGSAFGPGGVRARCRRHLQGGRPHWHMDYLRPLCRLQAIWYTHDTNRREHQWAALLAGHRCAQLPFPGFGSCDCDCASHLLWFRSAPSFSCFSSRVHGEFPGHGRLYNWRLLRSD